MENKYYFLLQRKRDDCVLNVVWFIAGKTYSLMANDGITANMVNKLFAKISRDRDHTSKVGMSAFLHSSFLVVSLVFS